MVVLGIDPGYAIVGWGVIDYNGNLYRPVAFGAITTDAGTDFNLRLSKIYDDTMAILKKYKPDALSIEKLYFTTNVTTAILVAQARGVILLAAQQCGVKVYEYTPLQVKQSVVGYGRAEKRQVMLMTQSLLGLEKIPKPDDAADALALAICHAHSAKSKLLGLI